MEQKQPQFTRRLRCAAEFGGVRFALTFLSKHFRQFVDSAPDKRRSRTVTQIEPSRKYRTSSRHLRTNLSPRVSSVISLWRLRSVWRSRLFRRFFVLRFLRLFGRRVRALLHPLDWIVGARSVRALGCFLRACTLGGLRCGSKDTQEDNHHGGCDNDTLFSHLCSFEGR